MSDEWIWVPNWERFQHYQHVDGQPPAWTKMYTQLIGDESYLSLTSGRRALLHGLWLSFASARLHLRFEVGLLNGRMRLAAKMTDYQALVDAGFIQVCSRETLDQLYNDYRTALASRAPAQSREEEKREEVEELSVGESSSSNRSDETRTPRASPNGRAAVSQLETLKAYVHRVWDDYPDKGVLVDELGDRGATYAEATNIITAEQEAHD